MMKIISKSTLLSSVVSLVIPTAASASLNSAYASLVDTSQNLTFESRPQTAALSKRPVSPYLKLAAVHFITNENGLQFGGKDAGGQEFNPGDLCKSGGFVYQGCPAGYIPGQACPEDDTFVKECINPDIWCKDNGYNVTSCTIPKYLSGKCPYSDTLYKSCDEDASRACKNAGYIAECDLGKVEDKTCPYDSKYKTCVCNPCSGFDYTPTEASAQGYTPGDICNSCGTLKYKRNENPCNGFKECTDGGVVGAEVCYSGNVKKFSECKNNCASRGFRYTKEDCSAMGRDYVEDTRNGVCDGKYIACEKGARILYNDGTVGAISEVYDNYLKKKIPVGFVIDEDKRLAVALTNIKEYGTLTDKKVSFASGINNNIQLQRFIDYNIAQSSSGEENTKMLLNAPADYPLLPPFGAAELAHEYQPPACSQAFCKKGQWFLPSPEEWRKVEEKIQEMDNTRAELYGLFWTDEMQAYYGPNSGGYHKNGALVDQMRYDITMKQHKVNEPTEYSTVWLAKDYIHFASGFLFDVYAFSLTTRDSFTSYSNLFSVRPLVKY